MQWPERTALAALAVLTAFVFLAGILGDHLSLDWWSAFVEIDARFAFMFVLPLWLLLRAIDFIFGGPAARSRGRGRSQQPRVSQPRIYRP